MGASLARIRTTTWVFARPVTLIETSDSEAMGIHSEAGLNRKFVEFAKLLNIYLNHFPKHEKYALAYMLAMLKEAIHNGENLQIPENYRAVHNVLPRRARLQPVGA